MRWLKTFLFGACMFSLGTLYAFIVTRLTTHDTSIVEAGSDLALLEVEQTTPIKENIRKEPPKIQEPKPQQEPKFRDEPPTIAEETSAQNLSGIENIHLVISTGCSPQQHWESEVLLFTWSRLQHPGRITRIVSGCSTEAERNRASVTAIDGVLFFFTGDNSPDKKFHGRGFHYFNKPYSVLEWISTDQIYEGLEDVVVILDPDMLLFEVFNHAWQGSKFHVKEGNPAASKYAIGMKWRSWNLTDIGCDKNDCNISSSEGFKYYSVGPPYIFHKKDLRKFAPFWAKFSPKALEYEPQPSTMAECYSFAIAAAYIGLRFQMIKRLYVSTPTWGGWEPWNMINTDVRNIREKPDIPVIHYCQGQWIGQTYPTSSYRQGGYNFHKGHIPKDILEDCSIPLMAPPPVGNDRVNEGLAKDKSEGKFLWMLYWTIRTINEGVLNYKQKFCPDYRPDYRIYLQEGDSHRFNRMWYIVANPGEKLNTRNKYGPHYSLDEVLVFPPDWDSELRKYDKRLEWSKTRITSINFTTYNLI